MELTYEEYLRIVVEKAYVKYGDNVCIDTVKDSYINNLSIDEAVHDVLEDSKYWDGAQW